MISLLRGLALLALMSSTPLSAADPPVVPAPDKPVPLSEAAGKMTVPEGFRVSLFAGEPAVVQPIAMTFDDRGRLWVVECLSYPKWRSDGTGNDRVVILEDTNGDGVHDKRTVFLDNGSNLSGIELGFGGVWLCSVPNLIFVPDRNGDDKPDGPPEVVLDGWNLKDTKHNIFNSLNWGPDGWLYGCNGIQSKSYIGAPGTPIEKRTFMDCGVWRYHPTKKTFEVYGWGTTNPFGLDWDQNGQLVITNCVIDHLWHVVPGSHAQRMYGQDPNPYIYEPMRSASDHKHWAGGAWTSSRGTNAGVHPQHSDAGGGHAHSGCAVNLGDNFPPEYRNSVFMCNIHGNRVNRDTLSISGSGIVGKHAPDFLNANDPWFRGICVKFGPDGGMYVSDWTDTGECHNYQVADTSNGRIYRVIFGGAKTWSGDVSKLSDAELVKLLSHKNDWFARKARRNLQERAAAKTLEPGTRDSLMQAMNSAMDPHQILQFAWALHGIGGFTQQDRISLLTNSNAIVRSWAVQLAVETPPEKQRVYRVLERMAISESSPVVRMALASAMQRVSDDEKLRLSAALSGRPEENADHNLTCMYWYGIQPAVLTFPKAALQLAGGTEIARVRESIVRLYLTRPGVELNPALADVVKLLGDVKNDTARKGIIAGVQLAIAGRRDVPPPTGWADVYAKLQASTDPGVRNDSESLAVQFGDQQALAAVKSKVLDPKLSKTVRESALSLYLTRKPAGFAPELRKLLEDPVIRAAAIRGLATYGDAETPTAILAAYKSLSNGEKADAVQTLSARPAFALALLDAIKKGTIPKADVTVFNARQILALNDKNVAEKLASVWGTVRPASATRKVQAERLKKLITPQAIESAKLDRGLALYTQHCATCHKLFGTGGEVGPELTGSQRANLDYLLENVLDPSAIVQREYRMTTFNLADGRTITGIIKKDSGQAVTIRTLNEELTIPSGDIDSRKETQLSIMPDGLFDTLKDDDVINLVAYLRLPGPLPMK